MSGTETPSTRLLLCLVLALVGLPTLLRTSPALAAQEFDVLIRGGMVVDGSGSPAFRADVGIRDGVIVSVGLNPGASAARVVDAVGLHLAPGFIDMHSHADRALVSEDPQLRSARNLIAQGITTVVVGPDGRNPLWPITDEISAYERGGVPVNVVPMVGHGTVRGLVMGDDYEREATSPEVAEMAALVRTGMEAGAWGLGAGPEYRPGRFSTTEEIVALAKVVGEFDGFYYAHQRSQSPLPRWQTPSILPHTDAPSTWPSGWRLTATDGTKETIRIGREAGIRVVGSHIKAKGPTTWGQSAIDVMLIDRARSEGVQVYLDQYPYETFGGGPTGVLPPWAFAAPGIDRTGGIDGPMWRDSTLFRQPQQNLQAWLDNDELRADLEADVAHILDLQGGADRHVVVVAPGRPETVGMTLAESADAAGRTVFGELIAFAMSGTTDLRSGVLFRPIAGHTEDVERYMRQEYTATSTDGGVVLEGRPGLHPRYFGTYPRKIAHYVRDRGVISLPFMVRSSTGLPAQIIGLTDRGYVREGQRADLVIFDFETVTDRATIMEPAGAPEGIPYVVVNGEFTVDGGRVTGALPGQVLRKSSR